MIMVMVSAQDRKGHCGTAVPMVQSAEGRRRRSMPRPVPRPTRPAQAGGPSWVPTVPLDRPLDALQRQRRRAGHLLRSERLLLRSERLRLRSERLGRRWCAPPL